MSEQAILTNTVGYYNGFTHPIQLMITKLGVQLILQPGEFILDRQGRKINDPFFDLYLNGGLKKETAEAAVPLISIPQVNVPVRQPGSHAVRGIQDVTPTRSAPAVPEQPSLPAPSASNPAIRGMTMEEARKAGFIKRTREVPEDYGPSDTDGTPPRPVDMKYAVDTVRSRKTELPREALEEAKKAQNSEIVQQLQKASSQPAAPSDTGFLNQVVKSVTDEDSPLVAGTPQEQPKQQVQETVQEVAEASEEVRKLTEPLPVPDVDDDMEDGEPEPEEEDEVPTPEAAQPEEGAEEDEDEPPTEDEDDEEALKSPVRRRFKRPAAKNRFVCPICDAPHKFRSQLVQHAQQSHPDQIEEILSKFPK